MTTDTKLAGIARWYGPADAISSRKAQHMLLLLNSYRAVSGPASSVIASEIVRELKALPGWRTPLRWFKKTNVRHSWVIVSYHHRAQLCWEWSVWFSLGRATRARSWNPLKWFRTGYGTTSIGIPWLFELSLITQRYGWMLSGDGENLIRFTARAQGIEAAEADETGTGSAVGESPVA